MEIQLKRFLKTEKTTISNIIIDGVFFNYALEDTDRGLNSQMSTDEIARLKIYGCTAIPTGKYKINMKYSPKFKKIMPYISDVKGFTNVMFHVGNYANDTLGCILNCMAFSNDMGLNSAKAYCLFINRLHTASHIGEPINLTIT